jgi:hypothetical protein
MERIKKNLFHVTLDILLAIHTPASLGGAGMNPVGGPIAGTGEAFRIDKGFQQHRADTIDIEPIIGKLMRSDRKDFAGEMRDLNPGKNQKSAVIDNAWKVALAGLIAPADPMIARRDFPCGAGKEQAGNNPI